jgi:hypothetical protein
LLSAPLKIIDKYKRKMKLLGLDGYLFEDADNHDFLHFEQWANEFGESTFDEIIHITEQDAVLKPSQRFSISFSLRGFAIHQQSAMMFSDDGFSPHNIN